MNERAKTITDVPVGSDNGEMIIQLVNLMGSAFNPLRAIPGMMDSELITAAVTYAGCIHGELIAMGMMDEDSAAGEEQVKLLLHNYAAGVDAGRSKVERLKTKQGKGS